MSTSVGFIGTFLYFCLFAIKAQTIPEAGLVAMDRAWNHEINLPTSDDLCGIWVNLTAWWQPADAPELSGNYTIALEFEHPNFKETKNGVMEIQHDIMHDEKESTKAINICFSHCPTLTHQEHFTIHATSDNIQPKNVINVQITSQKMSTLSYIEHCSDRKNLVDKIDTLVDEKETLAEEKETLAEEKETLAEEKETLVDENKTLVDENETSLAINIGLTVFLLLFICLFVCFVWNRNRTQTGGSRSGSVLPGPGLPPGIPNSSTSATAEDSFIKGGTRGGRKGKKDE